MNDPILAGYVFSPSARTIDFSAVPGFSFSRLFAIEHKPSGKFLYLAAAPDASLTGVISANGLVLTINAAIDLTGMQTADPLSFRYDPVPVGATDAKLETVRAAVATGNATLSNLSTGLGTPSDAAPGSDSGAGSLIAKLTRLLLTQSGIAVLLGAIRDRLDISIALSRGSTPTTDTSGTASAGTSSVALAANTARQFIEITNTGANPMAYRWGAAATGASHILGPGQSVRYHVRVPTGSLNVFSANGTSYFVTAG